jgi:hypothetical protein
MKIVRMSILLALLSAVANGCSSDGSRGLRVGEAGDEAGSSAGGAAGIDNPGGGGGGIAGGIDISDNALEVEIQHEALAVELVTLSCSGECAEVEAVASGGNPAYTFAWDDGEREPVRTLCPNETTTFAVAVTDSPIDTDELSYEAHTERAEVTAEVLRCPEDGGVPPNESDCGPGATAPFLLVAKRENAGTDVYMQENGTLADYVANVYGLESTLAVIASATREIHLGTCTQLFLAGDAAGTQNVGWDDTMIVEYRSAPGAAIGARWLYGAVSPVTYVPTGEQLTTALAPTVAGWDLDPPVPNPLPFGYAPLAIDLMREAPTPGKDFDLTIHVLDASSFGSTTDIWVIPR